MKKGTKIFFVIVIIAFVGWFIWQRYAKNNKSGDVDTYTVGYSDIMETISASGDVTPIKYANLSFNAPARVEKINAEIGDTVKKGEKLIIIDRDSIFAEIQSAKIDVQKAEASERLARRKWDNLKPEEKEQIIKNVEQARTRLYGAQSQIQNTEIVSPIDGIVTQKNVRVGEVAQGVVMRVIDESDMDIEVLMSETDAAKMHEGQDAYATFDAYNDKQLPVNIVSIDPEATKIQDVTYYKIKFTLPSDIDEKILSGMSVDVDVVVNKKDNVLTVPLRFVRKDDTGEYVYTMDENGTYQKRYVTTGVEGDDGDVEILKGLDENVIIYAVKEDDIQNSSKK
jgi:HlyD family secretion protein